MQVYIPDKLSINDTISQRRKELIHFHHL